VILFVRQIIAVALKDLAIELRSPVRVFGVFMFALALVLMVAFASGTTTRILHDIAGGTLWVGLLLTSTRSLDQSFSIELEEGALEELVLRPVEAAAIFYGKAIANTVVLWVVTAALTPLVMAVFDAPLRGPWWQFFLFLILGNTALAAPGTLYAALTSQARGSSVLLPLLLFPLVVPALMAAARGTTVVMEGDPMGQATAWLGVLVVFNLIQWSISGILFRYVVEEP
jgi:heme exporter protein B